MRNPNGTGSIFKKKGKSRKPYIVRAAAYLTEEGKYKRPIIGSAETLKEAKKILFEFNSRNLNVDYADLKLIDLFNRWTESNHVKNIKTEDNHEKFLSLRSPYEHNAWFWAGLWKPQLPKQRSK